MADSCDSMSVVSAERMSAKTEPPCSREQERRMSKRRFNSASATSSRSLQLAFRGTFICSIDHTTEEGLTPRASSDPGSECSKGADSLFSTEHQYVELLADQMQDLWEQDSQRKQAQASPSEAVESDRSPRDELAEHVAPHMTATSNQQFRMNRKEVRRHITAETQRRSLSQHQSAKWNSVLSVIQEIPEEVELVLQTSVATLADQVKDEVEIVRTMIRGTGHGQEESESPQGHAAENIQSIPNIVVEAFEASLQKARNTVRRHVDGVIHDIVVAGELGTDHMVEQMRLLPGDLREIAGQAIEEATHEFKVLAWHQIDTAIQQLPEDCVSHRRRFDLSRQAKEHIVATVPPKMPDTLCKVAKAAESKIEQVVAEVKNAVTATQHVTNQVVADTLLRGRVDGEGALLLSRDRGVPHEPHDSPHAQPVVTSSKLAAGSLPSTTMPTNPGSWGHPELCPRPCLYYAMGQGCANGNSCCFCHMPHKKRPVHLDKLQREILRNMPAAERRALLNPVLKKKLNALDVDAETLEMIFELVNSDGSAESLQEDSNSNAPSNDFALGKSTSYAPHMRKLLACLNAMSVRGLLVLVQKDKPAEDGRAVMEAGVAEATQRKSDLDAILERLRFKSDGALRGRIYRGPESASSI